MKLNTQKISEKTLLATTLFLLGLGCVFYLATEIIETNQRLQEFEDIMSRTHSNSAEHRSYLQKRIINLNTNNNNNINRLNRIERSLGVTNKQTDSDVGSSDKNLRMLSNNIEVMTQVITQILLEPQPYSHLDKKRTTFDFYDGEDWKKEANSTLQQVKDNIDTIFATAEGIQSKDKNVSLNNNLQNTVLIGGIVYSGMEVYDNLNGVANKVRIYMPSFAGAMNNTVTIKADTRIDEVYLDGCLKWEKVESLDSEYIKYKAIDTSGNYRFLLITQHTQVVEDIQCNPNYSYIFKLFSITNVLDRINKIQKYKPSKSEPKTYKVSDINNLKVYRSWIDNIKDNKVRRNLKLLTDIMENSRLPTEFPRPVQLTGKVFSPEAMLFSPMFNKTHRKSGTFNCSDLKRRNNHELSRRSYDFIIGSNNNVNNTINCASGDQIYILNDVDDVLNDSWGNDIVFPAKGNDKLDLGWGQDIVVLEKGWGKKQITKTCTGSNLNGATFQSSKNRKLNFWGVGLQFKASDGLLFVQDVIEGSSAQKAGLKKGDRITNIDGFMTQNLKKNIIIKQMLDDRKDSLDITYTPYPTRESKSVKLEKSLLITPRNKNHYHSNSSKREDIKFQWPFQYNNFIVFGPGINKDDLERDGNTLTLKETGDTVTFSDCFNFIYSGDMKFSEPSIVDENGNIEKSVPYTNPPKSLDLEKLAITKKSCSASNIILSTPGEHFIDVPSGCTTALIKAWGAGGGGTNHGTNHLAGGGTKGGTGGFSIDVLDVSKGETLTAIVGGRGSPGKKGVKGLGGANGGGNGGEGSVTPSYTFTSGGGGGGRSEVLVNNVPVVVAGGGGGAARSSHGLPGGGQNPDGFLNDYMKYVRKSNYHQNKSGLPGGNAIGGQRGKRTVGYSRCILPSAGKEKNGGHGARDIAKNMTDEICGAGGGGGGGGGYGGGGGGALDTGGTGGGGGGFTSEYGISLWGGQTMPANSNDADYISPHGQSQESGLIVISWAAPEKSNLKRHLEQILPYQMRHRFSPVSSIKEKSIKHTEESVKHHEYMKISNILGSLIRVNSNASSYLNMVDFQFNKASNRHNYLDKHIIEEIKRGLVSKRKKQQRLMVLMFDNNFDDQVTREEIKHIHKEQGTSDNRADSNIKKIMLLDTNSDGVVSSVEMVTLSSSAQEKLEQSFGKADYNQYVQFDHNNDKITTLDEIKESALKSFHIVDLDNDGKISNEEHSKYRKESRPQKEKNIEAIRF